MKREPTNDESREAARQAVRAGDPGALLRALAADGTVERLARYVERRFGRLDDDDVRWVVGRATDALVKRASAGSPPHDHVPYLYKAAYYSAVDLSAKRPHHVRFDERLDGALDEPEPLSDQEREEIEAEAARRLRDQIRQVRALIADIKLTRSKQVLGIIFDALGQGIYLTNAEIGDMLGGLSKGAVAVAKTRGFDRLVDIAKAKGLLAFDFTRKDLELADEAEAVAAGDDDEDM